MQNSEDGQREENANAAITQTQTEVSIDIAREYDMKHPPVGYVLIFNHENFEYQKKKRVGTAHDARVLVETFKKLGFEIELHDDATHAKFLATLEKFAKKDYTNFDCLVVVVLSHGEASGHIHTYDATYPQQKLWNAFTADKCPSLAGKPKLFFIQACRGKNTDNAVIMTQTKEGLIADIAGSALPIYTDVLIAQSTAEGYVAWRNFNHGTWFIQELCKELAEHGRVCDLLTILTSVCRRVAMGYQAVLPDDEHCKKQVPAFTSKLTGKVFFR